MRPIREGLCKGKGGKERGMRESNFKKSEFVLLISIWKKKIFLLCLYLIIYSIGMIIKQLKVILITYSINYTLSNK